jgi:uncharacterized protein (TIGR00251 family)
MSVIAVRVTPRASRSIIEGWRTGADGREELYLRVTAEPSDGAANEAVIALLANSLKVSRSQVSIISGQTARQKRVEVPLDLAEIRRRVGA